MGNRRFSGGFSVYVGCFPYCDYSRYAYDVLILAVASHPFFFVGHSGCVEVSWASGDGWRLGVVGAFFIGLYSLNYHDAWSCTFAFNLLTGNEQSREYEYLSSLIADDCPLRLARHSVRFF